MSDVPVRDAWRAPTGLLRWGGVSLALAVAAVVASTALPAKAAAPSSARLRHALLTHAQLPTWYRGSLPAPEATTFCNLDRRVAWQSYAGAFFMSRAGTELDDALVGYPSAAQAQRAYREARLAAYACGAYRIGGGFTISLRHVAAPVLGDEAFALRTKAWNGVGAPTYCLRALVRYRQVTMADGLCGFTPPSWTEATALFRTAYRTAVSGL